MIHYGDTPLPGRQWKAGTDDRVRHRKIKTNFDRDVVLDISTRELEFKHEMFPLNIIFDSSEREDWADSYKEYHGYAPEIMSKYKRFRKEIIDTITKYKLPVIKLDKDTPREAVCKVFENVNTGGVALTVFWIGCGDVCDIWAWSSQGLGIVQRSDLGKTWATEYGRNVRCRRISVSPDYNAV